MSLTTWRKIALLRRGREPLAWWRGKMADDFEKILPFLVPCEGLRGTNIPCPTTGIRLTLREDYGGNGYRAVPTGDYADSTKDQVLTWEEAQAWQIRDEAVRDALAGAFGLAASTGAIDPAADVHLVGICERNGERRPVYLCHATNTENAVRLAADAGRTPGAGCILLSEREIPVELVLKGRGLAGVPLAECATWTGDKWHGGCGEVCKGCQGGGGSAAVSADVSGRLRAKRVAAGRKRSVVFVPSDRKAIRVEVQRLIDGGLPHTEAYKQVSDQAQNGRAGQRKLTMKYHLAPTVATASVVRRVFESER